MLPSVMRRVRGLLGWRCVGGWIHGRRGLQRGGLRGGLHVPKRRLLQIEANGNQSACAASLAEHKQPRPCHPPSRTPNILNKKENTLLIKVPINSHKEKERKKKKGGGGGGGKRETK